MAKNHFTSEVPPREGPQEKGMRKVPQSEISKKTLKALIPSIVVIALSLGALLVLQKLYQTETGPPPIGGEVVLGAQIPDLDLVDLDGQTRKLSQLSGKVFLINFWATWCAPCRREIPSINALRKKYHDHGFEVIGIDVDENPQEVLPSFQKKLNMEFTSYLDQDGVWSDYFNVSGIPFSVIVNSERKILLIENGDRNWFSKDVQKQLETWLGLG